VGTNGSERARWASLSWAHRASRVTSGRIEINGETSVDGAATNGPGRIVPPRFSGRAIPGVKMADSSATRSPTSAGPIIKEGEELVPMRESATS